jgi:hypothetical protein
VQTKTGYDSGPLSLAHDVPLAVMPVAALLNVAHREGASCAHRHAATVSETKKLHVIAVKARGRTAES